MFQSQIAFRLRSTWWRYGGQHAYCVEGPFAGEVIDLWAGVGATLTAGAGLA